MKKQAEDIFPWENAREHTPEDPELHALALTLHDKELHAKIDIAMSIQAERDAREHEKILARSRQLLANDPRFS
jgi:hypothetical protein